MGIATRTASIQAKYLPISKLTSSSFTNATILVKSVGHISVAYLSASARYNDPAGQTQSEKMPEIKFYFAPGACSLAPNILLREIGIEFEDIVMEVILTHVIFAEELSRINPKTQVPAISCDGEVITEVACCNGNLKPGPGYAPDGADASGSG